MSPNWLTRARYKLPNTFWPPHNISEYRGILKLAQESDYRFNRLIDLHSTQPAAEDRVLILRHDIDTDPQAALLFAQAEEDMGVRGTYFFRLNTINRQVMTILHQRGHEIGYHYEELTAYAVNHHLRNKQEVLMQLPEIKQEFINNLSRLRRELDLPLVAAAAHGDFTYPILDLGNKLFLQDDSLRQESGLVYEAYDKDLVAKYRHHLSDKPAPQGYFPFTPQSMIAQGDRFLLLSHPRWWVRNAWGNIITDVKVNISKLRW